MFKHLQITIYSGSKYVSTNWGKSHNLAPVINKTRKMIVDLMKVNLNHYHPPLTISSSVVKRVNDSKSLRINQSDDMTLTHYTPALTEKAHTSSADWKELTFTLWLWLLSTKEYLKASLVGKYPWKDKGWAGNEKCWKNHWYLAANTAGYLQPTVHLHGKKIY